MTWMKGLEQGAERSEQGLTCTQETKENEAGEFWAHGRSRKRAESGGFLSGSYIPHKQLLCDVITS